MASIAIMAGCLTLACGVGWAGGQGLRGVPDSNGKVTARGTAIACLVIAVLLLAAAAITPFALNLD